jgi:hypothetical protein
MQRPTRFRLQGFGDLIGILDIGENLDAPLVVGLSNLCNTDFSGASIEQTDTETFFKRLHMSSDYAGRQLQMTRRGREAGTFDNLDER